MPYNSLSSTSIYTEETSGQRFALTTISKTFLGHSSSIPRRSGFPGDDSFLIGNYPVPSHCGREDLNGILRSTGLQMGHPVPGGGPEQPHMQAPVL